MNAQPQQALAKELMELVFEATCRLRQQVDGNAAKLGLSPAQAQALAMLKSPAPMRELADSLGCDASNVTGIVDGLERHGLVRREPDPRDRRVKQLVLTPEGQRARDTLHTDAVDIATAVFALPPEDLRTMRDLLGRALAGHDKALTPEQQTEIALTAKGGGG